MVEKWVTPSILILSPVLCLHVLIGSAIRYDLLNNLYIFQVNCILLFTFINHSISYN